jgi:hypothetical protein
MARYNLFHCIHKALKALLYDAGMLLQRSDFTNDEEAKKAISRLQFLVKLFEKQYGFENLYVWALLADYEPGVADSFVQDHREGYQLGKKLEDLVLHYENHLLPLEKRAAGNNFTACFEAFTLFYLRCMARKETVVNKILWRYYTDAELRKIVWKMISGSGSAFQQPFTKWLFRGLCNQEMVDWLEEVKTIARQDDFSNLLKSAEAGLPPRRWSPLQDARSISIAKV